MKRRIVFVCQYNFGIGHLVRSMCLCEAFKRRMPDARVVLVNGGEPLVGIPTAIDEVVQLPPIRKQTLALKIQSGDVDLHLKRVKVIGDIIRSEEPTHFITEYYPFSPERMHSMIGPHVPCLKSLGTCMISSVRDIPVSDCHGCLTEQVMHVKGLLQDFDFILHHTDPSICDASQVPKLSEIFANTKVVQTGLVVREGFDSPVPVKDNALYVSVGGGRDGIRMLEQIRSYIIENSLSQFERVDLVCGPKMSSKDKRDVLAKFQKKGIRIYFGFHSNVELVAKAKAAITMSGYNSLAEFASVGTRCLMFPRRGSFEQELRAELFATHGLGVAITEQRKNDCMRTLMAEVLSMDANHHYDSLGRIRTASFIVGDIR